MVQAKRTATPPTLSANRAATEHVTTHLPKNQINKLLAELGLKPWPSPPGPNNVSWKSAGSLLVPRASMGAVLAGQKVYVIGGSTGSESSGLGLCKSVECFDIGPPYHQALMDMMLLPYARRFMATVRLPSGNIYVIGDADNIRTNYEWVPTEALWERKADMPQAQPMPTGALGPDGRIYLMGGFTSTPLNIVQCFNPADGTWSQRQPLHTARFKGAAASANNKLYVFGGMGSGGIVHTVEEYDCQLDKWTQLGTNSDLLTARWNFAAVTGSNGRIYVIGGAYSCTIQSDAVEEFDPATKTWRELTPIPTARSCPAAVATTDGRIFVIGGARIVNQDDVHVGTIEEGTLPTF